MKFQQLRYISTVARRGLKVSDAAQRLHTTQPGVSKQIRMLEEELGVDIFQRNGKRLVEITEAGKIILGMTETVLQGLANIKQVAADFADEAKGSLIIATTHTQARYALPPAVKSFTERYPGVRLRLHQGNPTQISEQVVAGQADIGIATEKIASYGELVAMPCYQWNRCVVALPGHPVLEHKPLTLEEIAKYPIITYDFAFAGRTHFNRTFEERGLRPNVVLTAIDSDVIKTYVELGLGIGVLANMAFNPERDTTLRAVDVSDLFEPSTTYLAVRRSAYLRGYVYAFIEMFAPHLTRKRVEAAMHAATI
ncbi:MAG: transcriptional regulator CysB [Candidatus Muproteobacteria bacterium RBG_16_65_34]|uniref:Transcriptional regulator CysB n=1 Tax=Candidatus Muproteobacteria bacterium RBG_16_65_34 TaxID=1817760 RepID=A0A1F6TSM0_9PROT|nr:MAG: transcriptional regulator CysB [Candidatus Muproteobacteria bacterium RBG_16_65_34]